MFVSNNIILCDNTLLAQHKGSLNYLLAWQQP